MKRYIVFALAIALLGACSTKEIDIQTPVQDDVVFYASFEQPTDISTKVYANEDLLLRWTADDRVSIFNKLTYNQEYKFTGQTGANAGGFKKVDNDEFVTGNTLSHVVSVYPYQEATSISEEEVISLTLPAEQVYAENTFGLGANTMVSVSEDNVLQYKNVGGYLMLKLYGEGVSVSSITLKGNNGEKLAGKATVTMPLGGVPSVALSSDATTELTLTCTTSVQLGATEENCKQFWFVVPPMTFNKGFTITLNDVSGGVIEKSTAKSIIIERNKLLKMSPVEIEITEPEPEGIVDLGLSVKWATCNLGATKPGELGNEYQWGDPAPKSTNVDWSNYIWCNGDDHSLTKYCCDSNFGLNGFVDNKVVLDQEDDAAFVALGGKWRMPTIEEVKELTDNCSWECVNNSDMKGLYAISKINGNRLFFPIGPYSYWAIYLSSSLYADHTYYKYQDLQINDLCLYLSADEYLQKGWVAVGGRAQKSFIRPVYGRKTSVPVSGVSINKTELSIPVGRTKTIEATVLPENATDKTVLWSSDNPGIAAVNAGEVTGISVGNCIITATSHDGGLVATCRVSVVPKSDPSFYSSTDFSKDGEIVLLHEATVGKGVNLILLGDGFVDTDMSSGGNYERKMIEEMNHLFSYEPYLTFKNRFNVYCVKVVSTNKEYNSEQSDRAFSYELDGNVYFRRSLGYEYAERVPNPYNQPLKIAVIFNINRYFARSFCNMELFSGNCLAFILDVDEGIVPHELGGHGFAFLADEYEEYSGSFSDQASLDQQYNSYGFGANVDWRNDVNTVKWSRFITDNRYSMENIGLYEGAYLYPSGIYRPTFNSMMRNHYISSGKAFNAPSREQIYKTIMRYSEGSSWSYDYEEFVAIDDAGRNQASSAFNSANHAPSKYKQKEERGFVDTHMPPVILDRPVKEICVDPKGKVTLIQ